MGWSKNKYYTVLFNIDKGAFLKQNYIIAVSVLHYVISNYVFYGDLVIGFDCQSSISQNSRISQVLEV